MSFFKKNFYSLSLILVLFLIDRISKYLIISLSKHSEELIIQVTSFLNFILIWNNGIAFGLLPFNDSEYYNSLTLIIIFITLVLIYFMFKTQRWEKFGLILIISGALGNIYDRIHYASVVDFIDLHFDNFHWFVFNVADIFITVGVILLILLEIFKKKKYE